MKKNYDFLRQILMTLVKIATRIRIEWVKSIREQFSNVNTCCAVVGYSSAAFSVMSQCKYDIQREPHELYAKHSGSGREFIIKIISQLLYAYRPGDNDDENTQCGKQNHTCSWASNKQMDLINKWKILKKFV